MDRETVAPLKLRPGRKFDVRAFTETERHALQAGIEQGYAEIRAGRPGKTIEGWTYGERDLGNFGDDYLYRATTALAGLGALEPAEAVYDLQHRRERPAALANRYQLPAADGLPPARAFWSLAMYEVTPEGAPSSSTMRSAATPSVIAHRACGNLPMARSLFICSTTGRRATARPIGCPPLPGPCAWCSGPMNQRKP
jgi:hypothetical protein